MIDYTLLLYLLIIGLGIIYITLPTNKIIYKYPKNNIP